MTELGQLDARHEAFEKRNVRIVAISVEGLEKSGETQKRFPHLIVAADQARQLADQLRIIHRRSDPQGGDTTAPTTILIDDGGIVRWMYRPKRIITRLSPDELLAQIDRHLP